MRKKLTTKDFIERAIKVHGDKYDYSKVEYINNRTEVCIICPTHGEFWQRPDKHLLGHGCNLCCKTGIKSNTNTFIEKAKKIHGNKYDYSKVEYTNALTKVCIICPKHGEFWQTPHMHLRGNGCQKCRQSKLEKEIELLLSKNNIKYIEQCGKSTFSWLSKMKLDFYLPEYNIAIECQGEQHFKPIEHFGGNEEFKIVSIRDKRKRKLCDENNIKIIYYANYNLDFPYDVITTHEQLLEAIRRS